jgi:hypothetical protein
LIVDPLTGAMWSLTPKNIDAILETPKQFEEGKLKEQKEKEKELDKLKLEKENKPTVFGQPTEK